MRETREREVEGYLKRELWKIGLECVKFVPDQLPGMPDRMVLFPDGRVMWVELKTDGGTVSPLQMYRHRWLRALGHDVRVVWSKEDVDNLVKAITNDEIDWGNE